ncbi:MAG: SDR family oxidoreductase [Rhodobacteraceae bacterium]|nr:SDR family oxidoreductase [Paracoccaceae bacterium]
MQLQGKVALVTGAGGGIGRAVVAAYLEAGASVVGFDRVAQEDAPGDPRRYRHVVGDVAEWADNRRAVDCAIEAFGGLDILVGNAGIYDDRFSFGDISGEALAEGFDQLFSVNVKGYMLGVHAALPALRERGGCVVFTSSISGRHAGFGGALYVAAKHAVNGLTRQLALELAPLVRVNAVAPGYVETGLQAPPDLTAKGAVPPPDPKRMLLGFLAAPSDIADAYVFLASGKSARNITGTILEIDGGSALRGPGA